MDTPPHVPMRFSPLQKALFDWLTVAVIATLVGNAINIVVHALTNPPWWCGEATAVSGITSYHGKNVGSLTNHQFQVYVIASVFLYSVLLITLVDSQSAPTLAHLITWITGLLLEVVLLVLTLLPWIGRSHRLSRWKIAALSLRLVRITLLSAVLGSYVVLRRVQRHRMADATSHEAHHHPHEGTGLLVNGNHTARDASRGYGANGGAGGSAPSGPPPPDPSDAQPRWSRPTTTPSKSWWEYIRGYSLFFPYLWPSESRRLQVMVIICFILVMLQRVVNAMVPHYVGVVTGILSGETLYLPWIPICIYALFRLLQGSSGILGALRSSLWIPVGQYSYQSLSTAAFEHVHSLSLDFHLGKRTGEVLSALSKGSSINTFLEQVTFQVVPMLVDLVVAIAYFLIAFDVYYALVVAIVTACYMYLTIRLAQWRADMRRQMVNASRDEDAVKCVFFVFFVFPSSFSPLDLSRSSTLW